MKTIYFFLIAIVFTLIGWFANVAWHLPRGSNPITVIKPRPLDKYSIDNLSKAVVKPSRIEVGKVLAGPIHDYCVKGCTTYEFKMSFDPTLSNGTAKTLSGAINIPDDKGPFPILVMFRGFVDANGYFSGEGTQPAGNFFAKNGYITIAPDFLGYGESDQQASDSFESRFQTWTTAMTLFKTLESSKYITVGSQQIGYSSIGIWAHSNGGQIALTTLEITGATYPTVLWAPVSAPFPYSILFFTNSPGDYGKSLRRGLAAFEENYDTDLYSIHKYFDRIKAPIQLNQGSADEDVPVGWSDTLNTSLKDSGVNIKYIVYPGNDHMMRPNWNMVVENNLTFYQKYLK